MNILAVNTITGSLMCIMTEQELNKRIISELIETTDRGELKQFENNCWSSRENWKNEWHSEGHIVLERRGKIYNY